MKERKILVIRFSSIGDIVLTTPVVRAVKEQLLSVRLHYLTKAVNTPLLENNPYIDKVIPLADDFSSTVSFLKEQDYDCIVDLHKNIRSFRVRLALRKKCFSFDKLDFKKMLLVRFKLNLLPERHIVDRYFDAVKSLHVSNDGKGLDYFFCEKDHKSFEELPENFKEGYVAIVVGSRHNTKQMPEDILTKICNGIKKHIVLLGGKTDREKANNISETAGAKVFNACGLYDIGQSAMLLNKSLGVITPDTGLMHIAAALDKNIICLWGNTVTDFGMYPYRKNASSATTCNFEVEGLSCRPCSKLGFDRCPRKHFNCMEKQDTERIVNIANTWI